MGPIPIIWLVAAPTDGKNSNLRSLANSPSGNWPEERKAEYLAWARQVVNGARGVNDWLEAVFDEAARDLESLLNGPAGRR